MIDERVLCQQALMVLWQNLVSTGSFIEQLAIITGKVDFGWSKNISSRESSYHDKQKIGNNHKNRLLDSMMMWMQLMKVKVL